jgi:hypothetical protein
MTVNGSKRSRLPARPAPPRNRRPATPIELWYLDCLRTWSKHYKRLPKITELADYCSRAVSPTWSAMRSLEAKGLVERVEVDDPDVGTRRRFQVIEVPS